MTDTAPARDTFAPSNPFPDPEHEVITSPLVSAEAVDFRQPIPVGIEPDGEPVSLPLAGSSLLIAGSMASGVSSAAQQTAAAAVLDPSVELALFDSMDLGDWDSFYPLATWSGCGTHPRAVATVLRDALDEMVADLDERSAYLHETARYSPGLYRPSWTNCDGFTERFAPRLIVLAETEHFTEDRQHGDAIARAIYALARRGPRVGYALVLTTHQPNVLLNFTSGLREAIRHRLALRLPHRHLSDAALGVGSHRSGFDASALPRQPGTGILLTDGRPRLVRGYYLTDGQLEIIRLNAEAARGTLDPEPDAQ
jgi:hypothetical protein